MPLTPPSLSSLPCPSFLLTACGEKEGGPDAYTEVDLIPYGEGGDGLTTSAPEHLLFSRPLSLVELEVPAESTVIAQLLKQELVWVGGERYWPADFKSRLLPERLRGKARLYRAHAQDHASAERPWSDRVLLEGQRP